MATEKQLPNACKFCGAYDDKDACPPCVTRYLKCAGCGYINMEYTDGRMPDLLKKGVWLGMPDGCFQCGIATINKKVKAVGLPQTNFDLLSPDSIIRRRLCKTS